MNLMKIKTYVGFATKSRSAVIGTDNILKSKKNKLILVSSELSIQALNKIQIVANSQKIDIVKLTGTEMFSVISKSGIKALSITDDNLANAIKSCLTE
ncbi:MAG: hypothetical protein IJ538_01455 [Clostridia bacterium]|nr:hypothetical protein [Clostridia bacterium]